MFVLLQLSSPTCREAEPEACDEAVQPPKRPKSHSLAPAHPATLTLASLPRDRLVASQRLTSIDFPERLVGSNFNHPRSKNMPSSPNPPSSEETSKETSSSSTWQKGQSQFSKYVHFIASQPHLPITSLSPPQKLLTQSIHIPNTIPPQQTLQRILRPLPRSRQQIAQMPATQRRRSRDVSGLFRVSISLAITFHYCKADGLVY